MSYRSLPCCYYPTKVFFLDDNSNYLNNITLTLDKKIRSDVGVNPRKLAEKMLSESIVPFSQRYLRIFEDFENAQGLNCQHAVSIDFKKIYQELQNPERRNQISVLLVDYAMPGMNGVEFFQLLKHLPMKKVMVTGEADYSIAVDAFNEGVIDRFIVKDDPDFFEKINSTIVEMQKKYFQEMSAPVLAHLNASTNSSLFDPAFHDFFDNFIVEKNIEEYYLVDSAGSFLMRDAVGKTIWLVVKDDKELDDYYDIASEFDETKVFAQQLKQRHVIPFFLTEKDWQVPVNAWGPYLYPAQRLQGNNKTYYYSVIEGRFFK